MRQILNSFQLTLFETFAATNGRELFNFNGIYFVLSIFISLKIVANQHHYKDSSVLVIFLNYFKNLISPIPRQFYYFTHIQHFKDTCEEKKKFFFEETIGHFAMTGQKWIHCKMSIYLAANLFFLNFNKIHHVLNARMCARMCANKMCLECHSVISWKLLAFLCIGSN